MQAQVRPRWGGTDKLPFGSQLQRAADKAPNLLFLHPKTLVNPWPVPVDTLGEMIKAPSAVYPILAATISHLPIAWEISRRLRDARDPRRQTADFAAPYHRHFGRCRRSSRWTPNSRSGWPGGSIPMSASSWAATAPRRGPRTALDRGADFVVVGEGEKAFQRLMRRPSSPGRTTTTRYRTSSTAKARARSARPAVRPWSTSIPRRCPTGRPSTSAPYGLGLTSGFTAAIEVSRGCPHRCNYNINTYWEFKQRYKSIDRVMEMVDSSKLGVREFIFTDDNFGGDHGFSGSPLGGDGPPRSRHALRLVPARRHGPPQSRLRRAGGQGRHAVLPDGHRETLDTAWLKQHRKGAAQGQ